MVRGSSDWSGLLMAPFEFARLATAASETMTRSQQVVTARLPTIWDAWLNPWAADLPELGLMVSEKVGAAAKASRTGSAARLNRALADQARAFGRIGGGRLPTPFDWWEMAARNATIAAAMVTLPGEMLAPFHSGVTANAKRLSGR